MKLSMPLIYAGNPRETADQVAGLEKAGLDTIWVAEPYGFDSPTLEPESPPERDPWG